jgi:hypothetical protein
MKGIKLKDGGRYNYTDIERRLFSLLSEKQRTTSLDLAEKCFGGELFSRNNAVARMRTLIAKVEQNEEPFRIASDPVRRGPRPSEYWIERL